MNEQQQAAMRQALEALESCTPGDYSTGHVIHPSFDVDAVNKAIEAIDALAEQPAQQQKPVALPEKIYEFVPTPEPAKWHHPECEGECIACLIERVVQEAYGSQGLGYLQRHLTFPPAQRKPLTDEEIKRMAAPWFLSMYWPLCNTFARAIEAAHGIGEQK